jgi:DNA repair protein RecO (recombination protein O)
MELHRIEGIVLQTFPFQDYDIILTLFTAEEGIIKLIVKKALFPKKTGNTIPVPLTLIECVYAKGRGELYKCQEFSLIHAHLRLRDNLAMLESACDMSQAILSCQPMHSPAPDLYLLLKSYLEKLPSCIDVKAASTSFHLKILRHEGLMDILPSCSVCSCSPLTHHLALGENFCEKHRPLHYQTFSGEEMACFLQLAHCRTFSQLAPISLTQEFYDKTRRFFKELVVQ